MDAVKFGLIGAVIFVPLEMLAGIYPLRPPRKRWIADIGLGLFNALFTALPLKVLLAVFAVLLDFCVPGSLQVAVASQPIWLQVPEIVIITDLMVYLGHRMFHASPVLWKFHEVHHSAEEMDWLVALRNHPVEAIVMKTLAMTPVIVLGFSAGAIAAYSVLYAFHTWLVHANIRLKLGPLSYLIVGPEFHHWHHANERSAYNKNFAGQLAVWDWLFGTMHLPKDRRPEAYGVDRKVQTDLVGLLIHPFRSKKPAARRWCRLLPSSD